MKGADKLSDRDLDRILAGRTPAEAEDYEEVADLLRSAREGAATPVSSALEVQHVAAMSREAAKVKPGAAAERAHRARRRTPRRTRMTRTRLVALAGALVLAVPLSTAGLAAAGVQLPDPAQEAFDRLGIELPNQAAEVHAVIEVTPPEARGCAFGLAVAKAASQGRANPAGDPCERGNGGSSHENGNGHGDQNGRTSAGQDGIASAGQDGGASGVATDSAGAEFGHETAEDAQENAATDQRDFGERTAEGAQQLGSDQGAAGREVGDERSGNARGSTAPQPTESSGDSGQSHVEQSRPLDGQAAPTRP